MDDRSSISSSSPNSGNEQGGRRRKLPPSRSRRGVATGFRNFCITNEHPDGIVFCDPETSTNVSSSTPPPNMTIGNEDNPTNQEALVAQRRVSTSSSSTSIVSCSPCGSPDLPPTCSSVASENDTITLTSSSDEEMIAEVFAGSSKTFEPESDLYLDMSKTKTKVDDKDSHEKAATPCQGMSSDPTPSTSRPISLRSPAKKNKVAPQPTPSQSCIAASSQTGSDKDDGIPQFTRHKKFHYKTRTVGGTSTSSVYSDDGPSKISTTGNVKKQQESSGSSPDIRLSVDDLKLSPYITRNEAESRLRAIGNLEETQREIDAFAAIICTGAMFHMQMHRKDVVRHESNASLHGEKRKAGEMTGSSPSPPMHSQVRKQPLRTEMQVSSTSHKNPAARSSVIISSTASVALGSGGDVARVVPSSSTGSGSKDKNNVRSVTRGGGGGGHSHVTSPGQATIASDDYEWISD